MHQASHQRILATSSHGIYDPWKGLHNRISPIPWRYYYSISGAKIKNIVVGDSWGGEGGVAYTRYYRWSIGAPRSRDRNATHGRSKELPSFEKRAWIVKLVSSCVDCLEPVVALQKVTCGSWDFSICIPCSTAVKCECVLLCMFVTSWFVLKCWCAVWETVNVHYHYIERN